jgi:hypothetical protein
MVVWTPGALYVDLIHPSSSTGSAGGADRAAPNAPTQRSASHQKDTEPEPFSRTEAEPQKLASPEGTAVDTTTAAPPPFHRERERERERAI